jgi:hypothetical protein
MPPFDYNAPAELFLAKPAKGSRTKYRRFATAAEAIRYAVEDLRTPRAFGSTSASGGRMGVALGYLAIFIICLSIPLPPPVALCAKLHSIFKLVQNSLSVCRYISQVQAVISGWALVTHD